MTDADTRTTVHLLRHGEVFNPEGVLYGMPVVCKNGAYQVVQGLDISEFARGKMSATLKELHEPKYDQEVETTSYFPAPPATTANVVRN